MSRPVISVALAALVGLAADLPTAPAFAQWSAHRDEEKVIEIVVRYRDDALPAHATSLPRDARRALTDALGVGVDAAGLTQDGAFRFFFKHKLSHADALAAINRVRMMRPVLYAEIVVPADTSRQAIWKKAAAQLDELPTNRLIVKYRDPAITRAALTGAPLPQAQLDRVSAFAGTRFVAVSRVAVGAHVLATFGKLPLSQMQAIADALALDPDVEYAVPDQIRRHMLVPNDTNYASQWHYFEATGGANLPNAWDVTTGVPGIVVAVVDSGYLPHPDLVGRFVSTGYDFVADCWVANDGGSPCVPTANPGGPGDLNPVIYPFYPALDSVDNDAFDPGDWVTPTENAFQAPPVPPYYNWFAGCGVSNSVWHGTHVAGTIAAQTNNGYGVAGVAWKTRLLPVRVLGKCGGYDSDVINGVMWAAGLPVAGAPINPFPARVVNLSLGGSGSCSAPFQNAVTAVLAAGTALAIAAGNANHDASLDSPGNCFGVITVAATGRSGQRASYSNFGSLVELAAPGGSDGQSVLSTLNNGTTSPNLAPAGWVYAFYQGTSMATPHVAGVAALMLAKNPSLTPAQMSTFLQNSARAFPSGTGRDCSATLPPPAGTQYCGKGILDAFAALNLVPLPKRRDRVFDANANADLLWYSAASGSEVWLMTGVTPGTMGALRATPWVVAATGDFDGDGRTDIAWYNTTTGDAVATLMNGVTPGAAGALLFTSLVTQVPFTGDFDGDGRRDLLVRNSTTGALRAFLMNGNVPGTTPTILTDTNRVPSGVGDFNGDGKSDVVLRLNTTGATEIYLLNGGTILSSASIRADPTWIVHKVGDFNGDGRSDILWRNSVTGATEIWLMNGVIADATLPLLDGGFWQVLLVDDFDGDGRTDVLWRHAVTGALAVWLMNDFTPTKGAAFPVDPGWTVLLTGDYNGDGKADLVLRNAVNGQTTIWLMDGVAPTSSGVIRTSTTFAPVP